MKSKPTARKHRTSSRRRTKISSSVLVVWTRLPEVAEQPLLVSKAVSLDPPSRKGGVEA
jgi:hypothetical protein